MYSLLFIFMLIFRKLETLETLYDKKSLAPIASNAAAAVYLEWFSLLTYSFFNGLHQTLCAKRVCVLVFSKIEHLLYAMNSSLILLMICNYIPKSVFSPKLICKEVLIFLKDYILSCWDVLNYMLFLFCCCCFSYYYYLFAFPVCEERFSIMWYQSE